MALVPFEILLIDNDLNTVLALEEYLEGEKRIIHRASSGAEGFEIMKRENIGLVIADMICLLYTSPSPRDGATSRMPSSA